MNNLIIYVSDESSTEKIVAFDDIETTKTYIFKTDLPLSVDGKNFKERIYLCKNGEVLDVITMIIK